MSSLNVEMTLDLAAVEANHGMCMRDLPLAVDLET